MKARNAKSLSARCAWARVRSGLSVHVGKREKRKGSRRISAFPKKERGLGENRESSKESPLVLLQCFLFSIVLKLFFRKIASVRNKISSFALDKTQPPLFPPFCGVHIA